MTSVSTIGFAIILVYMELNATLYQEKYQDTFHSSL